MRRPERANRPATPTPLTNEGILCRDNTRTSELHTLLRRARLTKQTNNPTTIANHRDNNPTLYPWQHMEKKYIYNLDINRKAK